MDSLLMRFILCIDISVSVNTEDHELKLLRNVVSCHDPLYIHGIIYFEQLGISTSLESLLAVRAQQLVGIA